MGLRVLSRPCLLGQALPGRGVLSHWSLSVSNAALGPLVFFCTVSIRFWYQSDTSLMKSTAKYSLLFLLPKKTVQNWYSLNTW